MRAPTAPVPDSTRFTISLPNGGLYPSPSLSADGRQLVYVADNQLYLRQMDEFETKPIPGTEGARQLFFSPDGQWIGFLRGGELEKILMAGGAPVSIAALGSLAAGGSDPSWSADGVIIFGAYFSPLMHLSADGGPLSRLTRVDRDAGELSHHAPQILPDGEHVLFTVARIDVPRIAVNVSTRQLAQRDLQDMVANALRENRLDPNDIEIEITETAILEGDEDTALMLRDLRFMGIRLALDDFGTGYSSMSYVRNFPLDVIKMDRCFVCDVASDPAAAGVANAVIMMAHSLGLTVVAEGVDAEAQARILTEQGCDEMQGFLISGALCPEEFSRLLPARRSGA